MSAPATPSGPSGPAAVGTADLLPVVLAEVESVLGGLDHATLDAVADRLDAAGHVVVAGEGRSGFMARAFAMRLLHLGADVDVVGETTTPALRGGTRSSRWAVRTTAAPCAPPSRHARSARPCSR